MIFLFDPVEMKLIGHAQKHLPVGETDDAGVFEPGIKVGFGNSEFEFGQNRLPDFVIGHTLVCGC